MTCYNCLLFVVGLLVAIAYDDISFNKYAIQSHTDSGSGTEAYKAVDGDRATCMKTLMIGIGSGVLDKTVWWKVDLGGVYNIYSISILFKNYSGEDDRQRKRFAGFSLYVSDTDVSSNGIKGSTLCYKDGPKLPPLDFTTICTKKGRYVIYYNERFPGVIYPKEYEVNAVYTELCEVKVQGCQIANVYGSNCNTTCPINCKDNTCHIQSGACFNCKPGWTGVNCTSKCQKGWHGMNCSQQCVGHCKDAVTCNHVNGQCDGGCDKGWSGTFCDNECIDGTYGYNCINNCSGHCMGDNPCNKQTGHCDRGCNPGYTNMGCSKECQPGYFGKNCSRRCSEHCINSKQCDYVSGMCSGGCQDGYIEERCDATCKKGHFGTNCSRACSPNCKPDTCRHTDGSCTCAPGWMGYGCTTECALSYGENCQFPCSVQCINQTCDIINGSCLYGFSPDAEKYPQTASLSENFPIIVGGTLGACLIVIIGILFLLFAIRFKRKSTTTDKHQSFLLNARHLHSNKPMRDQSKLQNNRSQALCANDVGQSTYALPEKTKRGPPTNKNISVRNMKAQITNMSLNENAGFKNEYHDIPRGELHPCIEGKRPENKVKNRYTTIFPYDHSRVVLKTMTSNEEGYINANYIEDTQERHSYIATQGPKPKTIADFWTMIWQEDVCNIVCLTNLTEGAKVNT